jgi:hypothetical protein
MGEGDIGPVPEVEGSELTGTPRQSQDFHHAVPTMMPPDSDVSQALLLGEFADLKCIPRRQNDTVSAPFQFPDDGDEKRDVRRVVEIDPNLHSRYGMSSRGF